VRFNGRKENLHSLWDTALVELEQGTPTEIALRIQAAVNDDDRQWQIASGGVAWRIILTTRDAVYRSMMVQVAKHVRNGMVRIISGYRTSSGDRFEWL
jgi:hypothetical protein